MLSRSALNFILFISYRDGRAGEVSNGDRMLIP
jgi:hypothetical protein